VIGLFKDRLVLSLQSHHMKKLLPLFFFLPIFSNAQNGNLYGLYLGTSTSANSNVGVASVDPETAVVSYVNAFQNTSIWAYGDHTVDPVHHAWFQVWGDSINMYLSNFDIDEGTLTNILYTADSVGNGQSGTVTIGGEIGGTFYNCSDDAVYFFYFKAPWEENVHFAKADRTTGALTDLGAFPLGIQPIDNLTVPTHQFAYWLAYDNVSYAMDSLVTYDLVNLTHSSILLSEAVPTSSFWELTYNAFDGMLYGLQEDLDSFSVNNYLADLRYLKVDPTTGVVTDLTTDFLGNILYSNLAMDFGNDKLNVAIQTQNPGYAQIASYDILNGNSTINNISYTGFGSILGPAVLGLDTYLKPKDCPVATGENALSDCNDPISSVMDGQNSALYLGCHWANYLGMHLQVFDSWGRKISDQIIQSQLEPINLKHTSSQLYFYSIMDQNKLKASGKLMIAR